ncbi:MAG: 16S rRNA (adenine(1518)-N(6)/adenine(1519)-N(6))-dimethyltransferase RsmA [Candidatus Nealsonbacteria bacterium]
MSRKDVKNLLKSYGIRPSKAFGQNFLVNEKAFEKIIETAELSKKDLVLEIGPGIGNLTLKLAKKTKKVIAIEKDKRMCEILKNIIQSQNIKNIKLINKDILKTDLGIYTLKPYKLIANLPYYITSPVIRRFLEMKNPPESMILMIQKEVAQRICAKPNKMSLLAVSVQFYAKPKIISYISKKSFWPEPKVDSAIIKIVPLKTKFSKKFTEKFFKIVKAGFSHPRKQLINNLSKGLKMEKEKIKEWLLKNNVQPSQRAETLGVDEWQKLTKSFNIQ